eukprot:m51a1_g109 hypothetical protein (252) ;mRNA; f:329216-330104
MGLGGSKELGEDPANICFTPATHPLCANDQGGGKRELRIVCVSDTHERHADLAIPAGDVLIFAGDFSRRFVGCSGRAAALRFNEWLGTLPHAHKIVVCGNHDLYLSSLPRGRARQLMSNCTYLEGETALVEGVRIYGGPWTLKRSVLYRANAFSVPGEELERRWAEAAAGEGADIVVTHSPPKNVMDCTRRMRNEGSLFLRNRLVARLQPKLHVFGHNHDQPGAELGTFETGRQCLFVNAAITPTMVTYYV